MAVERERQHDQSGNREEDREPQEGRSGRKPLGLLRSQGILVHDATSTM